MYELDDQQQMCTLFQRKAHKESGLYEKEKKKKRFNNNKSNYWHYRQIKARIWGCLKLRINLASVNGSK